MPIEPPAHLFDLFRRQSEAGRHWMTAVFNQHIGDIIQCFNQMEPVYRTRAAMGNSLLVHRADKCRTAGHIYYLRTHNTNNAAMKSFSFRAREDQNSIEVRL